MKTHRLKPKIIIATLADFLGLCFWLAITVLFFLTSDGVIARIQSDPGNLYLWLGLLLILNLAVTWSLVWLNSIGVWMGVVLISIIVMFLAPSLTFFLQSTMLLGILLLSMHLKNKPKVK